MNKLHNFFSTFFERLSSQDKINFARHLALTVKAGLPIFEGLQLIRKQTTSKTLQKIVDRMRVDVSAGRFLADSLAGFRYIFGDFFISIVRVGETSGTLAANLTYLAEELEKSQDLRSKVKSALIYPIIILIATLGIVAFLVFFIFPKILPVFSNLKVKLPLPTRVLINVSQFLQMHGVLLLFVGVIVVVLFRILLKTVPPFRHFLHRCILFTPILSKVSVSVNNTTFTRVLGLLLKSGMPIVESITITSRTVENLAYQRALIQAAEQIRRGEQLASYLVKKPRMFPPLISGMIEIGENTGNLEDNLAYLSEFYAKDVDVRLRNLTAVLEPLMLLTMGIMVGFVALSIITPIYQLTVSVG